MRKAKVKILTLSVVLAMVVVALLPGIALGRIDGSCRFYGPVTVDGENVPDGTVVTAWLKGSPLGPWTATTYTKSSGASWYVVNVPMDDVNTTEKEGGVDGEEVCFNVTYEGDTLPAPSNAWRKFGFVYHPLRLTTVLIGDVNGDGHVNSLDLILVGQHMGETGDPGWVPEDVNEDGSIDILDIILIFQNWTG